MPLSRLNKEQLLAATASFGHNLIIASAGTGKTSTIVGRIAHLLKTGVEPEDIMLLTFTNKAASEMIARLGAHYDKAMLSKIEAGTFHAVSYRLIKAHNPDLALKQPTELKRLFRSIYDMRDFERIGASTSAFSAAYLFELYSLWQNASTNPFDTWFLEQYAEHEPYIDAYIDVVHEYEEQKERFGYLSFNDLLLKAIALCDEEKIKTYKEVLVDEYQDTNMLQGRFIDAIKSDSLFCVGDYDQSIYAFNGACIDNIATFTKRYSDTKVFTLQTNYRSCAPILSLANRVIERNERLYPKKLIVGKKEPGVAPKLLVFHDLFEQYSTLASLIAQSKAPKEQISVLFRNNASADGIEAALRVQGVGCKRKGSRSFFESKEVKFLLDLLSLVQNSNDMMAFIAIFEYVPGVGAGIAKELFDQLIYLGEGDLKSGVLAPKRKALMLKSKHVATQLGLFGSDDEALTPKEALQARANLLKDHPILVYKKLSGALLEYLEMFATFLSKTSDETSPLKLLRAAIDSALFAQFGTHLARSRARLKNGEVDSAKEEEAHFRIKQKAKLLLEISRSYASLERFLNAMVIGGAELTQGEGVHLLTVHASKGLEFEEVYVVDLVEGRFPNTKLMTSVEEERRLFYVAVTRAKRILVLSFAKHDRARKISYKPSRFLSEAGLIEP